LAPERDGMKRKKKEREEESILVLKRDVFSGL
jgi:hypothetical protein